MVANRFLLVALAITLVPACDDDDDFVVVGDPVGDAVDEGVARGTVLAADAHDELTGDDSAIVIGKTATIIAALNDGEISQSSFAIQVVDDDDIADFADRLIVDHQDANAVLDDVVRGYGVPFIASTAADELAAQGSDGLALLRQTPPGDVDFQFVQLQVINHAQAQVLLDELAAQVGPGAMGDYIADTQVMIDDHLAIATDLLDDFFN